MITIGICDDGETYRKQIRGICDSFFAEHSQQYRCIEFKSGEEVLNYQGEQIQLLFLDMELGGINGIEVKTELEKIDTVWRIVFVTWYEKYVWDSFGIKTLGFLRKPVNNVELEGWLKFAVEEDLQNCFYEFSVGNSKCFIRLQEILYLESSGNYTYLHTRQEKVLISDRLKICHMKMETAPMVRVHKSYVVNLKQVIKFKADKVILTDGIVIPIGRRYKKEAKSRFQKFVFN